MKAPDSNITGEFPHCGAPRSEQGHEWASALATTELFIYLWGDWKT